MENGGVVDLVEMESMCWKLRGAEGGEIGVGIQCMKEERQ